MAEIRRATLFGKLNKVAYQSVEAATIFCKTRGNPHVELVHWLHQVLQLQDSDIHRILKHYELNPSRLVSDLTTALDGLPRGSNAVRDISAQLDEAVERAWVLATLLFGESQVRTGYVLAAMLESRTLRKALHGLSEEFARLRYESLSDDFDDIVGDSPENGMAPTDRSGAQVAAPGEASGAMPAAQMGRQEALARFTVDLTAQAREGHIDPVVGRDEEIRQIVDILMRRRQNNPILTGEAGVGKTAVVEGFANRIAAGDVPPPLRDVTLRSLDVGLLQAGASMKGEFESRLKQVIEEVQSSEKPIILFIDEAHTLVGAGGAAGTGDAANLLKPALARGDLRTIAATTWAEYKKHIEGDPALTRRFQVVQVAEPSEEKAVLMLRSMASVMEHHHRTQVLDEALRAAVRLSHRYIPARQLPDKAVSLLDTACARVAISQHAVPGAIEDCRRQVEALERERQIIERERAVGMDVDKRSERVREELDAERARLAELEKAWEAERELVTQILDLRAELRGVAGPVDQATDGDGTAPLEVAAADPSAARAALSDEERAGRLQQLKTLQARLETVQQDKPLILPTVDGQAVAAVVEDWTGIPVGRMVRDEIDSVLRLDELLRKRIIGQDHALSMIARRIQTSRAQLDDPNKPIGVFLLAGTSGVGKTETALALAEVLYGGENNVITINMSEYQDRHMVSTLKGAPPGYVGYGKGGVLTEAVRRRPYSVVLLDEVEKAHKDVHEIFFQVFDKGWMEDSEGTVIDFKNTLILLTTNVGSDLIMNMCRDPDLMPTPEGIAKALREPLLKEFPPALLGRMVVIPYYPLSDEMIGAITRLHLGRIARRLAENHDLALEYGDDVVGLITSRCTELESGGRMVDAILTNTVLPTISRELLTRMMEGTLPKRVLLEVEDQQFAYRFD